MLFLDRLYLASDQQGLCAPQHQTRHANTPGRLRQQFYKSLSSVYRTTCLDNYHSLLLHDTSDAWVPLVEQLVCSEARVYFSATPASKGAGTFHEYIEELRDHMDDVSLTVEQKRRKKDRSRPCYMIGGR